MVKWFRNRLLILLGRLSAWLIEESPSLPAAPPPPPLSPFDEARQREARMLRLVHASGWRWEWRAAHRAEPHTLNLYLFEGVELRAVLGPCTGAPNELVESLHRLHGNAWCPAVLPPVPPWPLGLGAFEDGS